MHYKTYDGIEEDTAGQDVRALGTSIGFVEVEAAL